MIRLWASGPFQLLVARLRAHGLQRLGGRVALSGLGSHGSIVDPRVSVLRSIVAQSLDSSLIGFRL